MEKIFLNDLLCLNEKQIKDTKVRFNQDNSKGWVPKDIYLKDHDSILSGFLWRNKKSYFKENQIGICFIELDKGLWLLTHIVKIGKDTGIFNGISSEYTIANEYKKFFGRIIVKYTKSSQQNVRWFETILNELEINSILTEKWNGDSFPGYSHVRLSFNELKSIISSRKSDWIGALSNQKAIYLITDLSNGKLYVGSAYGDKGMLLQRWTDYSNDGIGGNKDFLELSYKLRDKYLPHIVNYFQYSILQIFDDSISNEKIIKREHEWIKILDSKEHGYNN